MIAINWQPSRREMKQFSLLLILFSGLLAYWVHQATGSIEITTTVFCVGATIGVVGFLLPAAMRYVYVTWMLAVFPIGWTISYLLLAIIFYGLVTPIGICLRLFGNDPMNRQINKTAKSYWLPRTESKKSNRYFQQF